MRSIFLICRIRPFPPNPKINSDLRQLTIHLNEQNLKQQSAAQVYCPSPSHSVYDSKPQYHVASVKATINLCQARYACKVKENFMTKSKTSSPSRREFIKTTTAMGVAGMASLMNQSQAQEPTNPATARQPVNIAIYLYDGMTALDAIGTYEVMRCMTDSSVKFVAKRKGAIKMDSRVLTINADYAIDEIQSTDVLVLPGGATTLAQTSDKALLEWVKQMHTTTRWTTSVCTGSLILAAAGLLKGQEATTHWAALSFLRNFGATPVKKRFVRQGKIITAAGVSAGMDMALSLVALERGEAEAKAIQLAIEYDPQPPFDSGSVDKAAPDVVKKATEFLGANNRNAAATR
jgi:putative intracellular protease/amidase